MEKNASLIPYYLVDVFTDVRFGGNQLAVFIDLEDRLTTEDMQQITREFNFSEVSFIKAQLSEGSFAVRIFTPEYEVPFAGHPVLGTAFVIARFLLPQVPDQLTLSVPIGEIPIELDKPERLADCRFTMQQAQPVFGPFIPVERLAEGLRIPPSAFVPQTTIQQISTGLPYLIIPLRDRKTLESLKLRAELIQDFLLAHGMHKTNSLDGLNTSFFFFTTETEAADSDYQARMLCLENGQLIEDPATGSANGCFLAYLLQHQAPLIKAVVEQGFQMGRKSFLYLDGARKGEHFRLGVGGQVALQAKGSWYP
ncbi:MAG: PhzF family phenazine biosynthesis protein [Bacteroidota bacterium]